MTAGARSSAPTASPARKPPPSCHRQRPPAIDEQGERLFGTNAQTGSAPANSTPAGERLPPASPLDQAQLFSEEFATVSVNVEMNKIVDLKEQIWRSCCSNGTF
jgi:hypothetical protein